VVALLIEVAECSEHVDSDVELGLEADLAHVVVHEGDVDVVLTGGTARDLQGGFAQIHAGDCEPSPGELEAVAAVTARKVEDGGSRRRRRHRDDVVDLCGGVDLSAQDVVEPLPKRSRTTSDPLGSLATLRRCPGV
jgi:hypothetical protein